MGTIPAPNLQEFGAQIGPNGQAMYDNAFSEYARVAQMKQNTALQGAQTQGVQQENQQRQLQMQDQQTLRQLAPTYVKKDDSGKVTGFDYDGLLNDAATKGVSPQTIQTMQVQRAQARQQMATATKDERENHDAIAGQATDMLEGLKGETDQQKRQDNYLQAVRFMQRNGLDVSSFPTQAPANNDDLTHLELPLGMQKQIITEGKTKAETSDLNAKARLSNAEADQKGSPLKMMETNPAEMAGDKLPANMAYLQSKIADPTTPPEDKARATRLLSTAKMAQQNQLAMEASKKATDQAIADGDPVAAGKLLHDGIVSPSQITSSRKPEFAQKAFSAAAGYGDGWNAQKAEADFKVASSPTNVAFFGSAKSLTDKGGTLDQLKDAAKDIPDGQIPIFNSIADAMQASTGSGPIAKYASILLGVSDDYSKVMGGGQGSDTSRNQALTLVPAKASPEARAAAIEGIRGAVGSQINSRIGSNPVLKKMYGDQIPSGAQGGGQGGKVATSKHVADYAKTKGITQQQAEQEFKASGYAIQ